MFSLRPLGLIPVKTTARIRYTPYGKASLVDLEGTALTPSETDYPILFTGQRHDIETSLVCFRTRVWNVDLGRFLQKDPLGHGAGPNLYSGNFVPQTMDPYGFQEYSGHPHEGVLVHSSGAPMPEEHTDEWGYANPGEPYVAPEGHYYDGTVVYVNPEGDVVPDPFFREVEEELIPPCPEGAKTRRSPFCCDREYRTEMQDTLPMSNGCGPAGSGWLIPDLEFTPACDDHDLCYGTCGSKKSDCDDAFAVAMMEHCASLDDGLRKDFCFFSAVVFFGMVSDFGEEAFESAQDSSCKWKCCD